MAQFNNIAGMWRIMSQPIYSTKRLLMFSRDSVYRSTLFYTRNTVLLSLLVYFVGSDVKITLPIGRLNT